jgi:type I restriction enzyme, S subunit
MKIKEICEYGKKSNIKAGEGLTKGSIKFFTSSSESNKYVNEAQFNRPGIIMGTGGNATLHYCDKPFSVSTDCLVLFPKIKLSTKYLYYFFRGNFHILESGFKGAGLKHTSRKYIDEISINHIPSIEKQNKIVVSLDKLIDTIIKKNQQLSEYDQLVKNQFLELFEDKYKKIKVSTKLRTTSGGTPKSSKKEYYANGTIPWLISGEVNQGRIYKTKKFITEKGLSNSSAKWIPEKSIVIAMYGATAGKVGIVEMTTTTNQAICSVLPSDEFIPEYLRFAFEYISDELAGKAVGGGQPNISQAIIRDSFIFNPPIEVQKKFSDFAQHVEKLKLIVKQSINETQKLFDSLMQEHFG